MEKDLPQRIVLMTSSTMDYTLVSIVPILLLLFILKIRKWETEGSKLSKIFVKNFERWRKSETWWAKRNLSEFLLPSGLLLLLVTKVKSNWLWNKIWRYWNKFRMTETLDSCLRRNDRNHRNLRTTEQITLFLREYAIEFSKIFWLSLDTPYPLNKFIQ